MNGLLKSQSLFSLNCQENIDFQMTPAGCDMSSTIVVIGALWVKDPSSMNCKRGRKPAKRQIRSLTRLQISVVIL